jgi:biotin carboxylase
VKKESIFILGAGIMQMPAIKAGKNLGYRVFVADVNPDAPGIVQADAFSEIDLKDYRAIADEAVRLRKEENLAAVFTAGTDFSSTVAYSAVKAGLPGIDYSVSLAASNKILMRRAFYEAGVPSPSFYPVKNEVEAFEACEKLEFPVVIKPVDSMGARGVVRIDSIDDVSAVREAVCNAVDASGTSEALVEEYIDGPEFSLDALVYNGKITICGFADRHIFFPPYFIEMGHTMPTKVPADMQRDVIDVFCRGIRALGIDNGAAKGDIKYSSGKGAMIGEIAARLSGGFMSGWTFPYHSGINLTEAAVKIAAGREPGNLSPKYSKVSAERAVLSIPGRVKHINGIDDARGTGCVEDVFLHTSKGCRVVFPVNNVQKCANVIAVDDDYQTAVRCAEEAVRKILIRLNPSDSKTRDFLERRGWEWVPDAFSLQSPENIEVFNSLKDGGALMFPCIEKESASDWHGMQFSEAFDKVKAMTACSEDELSRGFWEAFLRGGFQGGMWYIDTIRAEEIL